MITNFDDAYSNAAYIEGGADYPARWMAAAEHFREAMLQKGQAQIDVSYGDDVAQSFDLFKPAGASKGLCVFVHGGYWMRFDKASWSHLAAGAVARGWSVALPRYPLAPLVTIGQITSHIARAIARIARDVEGPIRLCGHSAGGHLVTRMVVEPSQLPEDIAARVEKVISISGVHDLRPLMRTVLNETLKLTELEARNESPALRRPRLGASVLCWVGADERPEFIRQNDLLANVWHGLGADMESHHAKVRHHFNVIEDLLDPDTALCAAFAP
jgi:arylformamidase